MGASSIRDKVNRPWFWFTDVGLPLFLGGLTYLLWRDGLLMFSWAEAMGLGAALQSAREVAEPLRTWIPAWWLYSFPDGAWVYAYTAHFGLIWRGTSRGRPLVALGAILGLGGEFGQAFGIVPGTFSWPDVLAMVAATVVAFRRLHHLEAPVA